MTNELITAFVTLFVVMDPIGLTPLFTALTSGMSFQKRRAIALRACMIAAIILIVFGFAGKGLLSFLGISLPAFRIAGGMLLFLTALEMLFEKRGVRRSNQADDPSDDPSVFPLAMPLIAGPGAIASMIILVGAEAGNLTGQIAVYGVMLSVVLVTLFLFMLAAPLEKLLGPTGINVTTRLLGMLLAALSVQFVLDGLIETFAL